MTVFLLGGFATLAFLLGGAALGVHLYGAWPRIPEKADVIVVAGARVVPPGVASPALAGRVERAVALHQQGLARFVLFTGGPWNGLPSEAKVAEALAIALGVPPEVILLEEMSRSTFENAHFGADVLKARQLRKVLLVTDGFHLLRAVRLFRAMRLVVQPVASGRTLALHRQLGWALREAVALLRWSS